MFRKIKPSSKKSRAFSYSNYTGKIVRDFRERQAGAEADDRQEEWQEKLKKEQRRQGYR
ncbi:MAG: hypothetical protein Q7K26_04825 [bacterium]|nr:hypothetical protein [bacterium]